MNCYFAAAVEAVLLAYLRSGSIDHTHMFDWQFDSVAAVAVVGGGFVVIVAIEFAAVGAYGSRLRSALPSSCCYRC